MAIFSRGCNPKFPSVGWSLPLLVLGVEMNKSSGGFSLQYVYFLVE
jgi:hypothetical protein